MFQYKVDLDPYWIPSTDDEEADDEADDDESEESQEDYEDVGSGFVRDMRSPYAMGGQQRQEQQFSFMAFIAAVLRKSLVTCSVDPGCEDVVCSSSMDISWPTDVKHISHVTFDRFNGFLGLPVELEPELPTKVPSASVTVFGVSPDSMQCSYDSRNNSVPTILLLMQKQLYSQGGLQAEGIFRINAENTQELDVREHLNRGSIPDGVDSHCLASLIKAWFRELPTGILDTLTPDQVMHCNAEQECCHLVTLLPPMEASLLSWAVDLMADVVEHEHYNKMNARNIAMVFAPNMTQMADPLTALIHAVQVMNFLKTLITKALRQREETSSLMSSNKAASLQRQGSQSEVGESFHSFEQKSVTIDDDDKDATNTGKIGDSNDGLFDKLSSLKKGVKKLLRFNKSFKKFSEIVV